jgi:hypothetical protein
MIGSTVFEHATADMVRPEAARTKHYRKLPAGSL